MSIELALKLLYFLLVFFLNCLSYLVGLPVEQKAVYKLIGFVKEDLLNAGL